MPRVDDNAPRAPSTPAGGWWMLATIGVFLGVPAMGGPFTSFGKAAGGPEGAESLLIVFVWLALLGTLPCAGMAYSHESAYLAFLRQCGYPVRPSTLMVSASITMVAAGVLSLGLPVLVALTY